MNAGIGRTNAAIKASGLVATHAYTVLGTAEYKGEKLVKMRNPWGSECYKGKWSDKDGVKWTKEARIALKHTE
jgi:hypothetical protein